VVVLFDFSVQIVKEVQTRVPSVREPAMQGRRRRTEACTNAVQLPVLIPSQDFARRFTATPQEVKREDYDDPRGQLLQKNQVKR
jgi:hypothetical protein